MFCTKCEMWIDRKEIYQHACLPLFTCWDAETSEEEKDPEQVHALCMESAVYSYLHLRHKRDSNARNPLKIAVKDADGNLEYFLKR